MDQKSAVALWNGITAEEVSDDTSNLTKFGCAAVSNGCMQYIYLSRGNVISEEGIKKAIAFLRKWADAIEGEAGETK